MTSLGQYRKKPVTITAVQWTGKNVKQMRAFAGRNFNAVDIEDPAEDSEWAAQVFDVLHSTWIGVYPGQWVIKGEFYPCDGEVFRATYEEV
jgi:hypothetical protein